RILLLCGRLSVAVHRHVRLRLDSLRFFVVRVCLLLILIICFMACHSFLNGLLVVCLFTFFFFQAEDGIRDATVTGVQTCALPISIDFTVCLLLVHRRYPGVRIGLSSFQWDVVRKIFSFSIYVLVLNAAGRLALQTDPLVIGATIGVSQIPYYAVANNFVVYALEFIVAIAAVVMPT